MQEDLEEKSKLEAEKQEFLAVMSHELRTPLTGVKGYLSMILDGDAGEISGDVRSFVAEAYVANDRLIRLVDKMSKTVAVQEGRIKLNLQKVDLVANIELLSHDFTIPAREKNLEIIYQKPESQIFVSADPDRLREILMNLLSNAVKFTDSGKITISHRKGNNMAIVDIEDTGRGINEEDQAKIFKIFTKTNLSLASQEKGTGLGLFLAKKLAQAQGGDIWLENSKEGQGSTFSASFKPID